MVERIALVAFYSFTLGWPINSGAGDPVAAEEAGLAVANGRISVTFVETPLADAIERVARGASFELERRGPLGEPVTVTLEDEPLPQAVSMLLGDHPHLMRFAPAEGGEPGRRLARLLVIDADRDGAAHTAGYVPPAQPEPPEQSQTDDRAELRAISRALRQSPSEAVPALALRVRAGMSSQIREAAVQALGRIASPEALEAVATALHDPEPAVRQRAIRELGASRSRLAARRLIEVLRTSSDPAERSLAAWNLSLQPDPAARRALEVALDDPEPTVRSSAEESLRRITAGSGVAIRRW